MVWKRCREANSCQSGLSVQFDKKQRPTLLLFTNKPGMSKTAWFTSCNINSPHAYNVLSKIGNYSVILGTCDFTTANTKSSSHTRYKPAPYTSHSSTPLNVPSPSPSRKLPFSRKFPIQGSDSIPRFPHSNHMYSSQQRPKVQILGTSKTPVQIKSISLCRILFQIRSWLTDWLTALQRQTRDVGSSRPARNPSLRSLTLTQVMHEMHFPPQKTPRSRYKDRCFKALW